MSIENTIKQKYIKEEEARLLEKADWEWPED